MTCNDTQCIAHSLNKWVLHHISTEAPQWQYVWHANGTRAIDHVLKFEKLHESFSRLMQQYPKPYSSITLPTRRENRALSGRVGRATVSMLGAKTKAAIRRYSKEDFTRFNYSFDVNRGVDI